MEMTDTWELAADLFNLKNNEHHVSGTGKKKCAAAGNMSLLIHISTAT